jgi:transmembrane sensor
MGHLNRSSASDAEWDGIARAMADEGAPGEREALLAARPDLDALDGAARRLAADEHAGVDVEPALAAVLARRERPAPPVIPLRPRTPRRWMVPALSAAAMLLLTLGAALVWRSGGTAASQPFRHATAAGEQSDVRLVDGTRVKLGGSSVLTLVQGYGVTGREVVVQGDAYFEVVHDERRPFVVRTHDAVVHDLGTAFSVRADSGVGTRVAVTDGVVTLRIAGARADTLRKGDRASTRAGPVVVERGAATGEDVAWTRGEIVFRDVPLATAAAELRRWYGVTVVADPVLGRRRITATFDARQKVDDVVSVLAATVGGRVQRRGARVLISP